MAVTSANASDVGQQALYSTLAVGIKSLVGTVEFYTARKRAAPTCHAGLIQGHAFERRPLNKLRA